MESDSEFLDMMWGYMSDIRRKDEHYNRLFALARKGVRTDHPLSEWRPIETAPTDGTRMLLAYRNVLGKWRRVIAFYAPKLTIEQSAESEWLEYDEALDRYCLPEGWYECIDNWDDYTHVHISEVEPTHWMPLPPPPKQENENE